MRLPLLLFLLALAFRLALISLAGFDGLYGQDAFAYYQVSLDLRQALAGGQIPPPFYWPLGYPALLVLVSLIVGKVPAAGQWVSVVAGSLIAPLVYLLVRQLRPKASFGALVAGLLAAFAGQLVLSSLSVMSDATALAWASLSALALLIYSRNLRLQWLALAALTLGLAVVTRWVYGLLALPWAIAALLAWRSARLDWRKIAAACVAALLAGGLIVGLQLAAAAVRGDGSYLGQFRVVGWDLANAFRRTVVSDDGRFDYRWPIGLFYLGPAVHPSLIFPMLSPFLLAGLWSSRRLHLPQLVVTWGWPLLVFLLLAGMAWENSRFALALFPPLLILTGLGWQAAWQSLNSGTARSGRPPWVATALRFLLLGWLGLALAGSLAWSARQVIDFGRWSQSRVVAARWTESRVPAGARLIAFDLTQTLEHYTELDISEIYNLDESDLATMIYRPDPLYVLLPVDNVESQWLGKSPERNYRWLRNHGQLEVVGQLPPYTLFRFQGGEVQP